jgi:hypothetical protein
MLIAALTIFAAIMGALAPTFVSLYLEYLKEPTAPEYIRNHPYQGPVIGMIIIICISATFLIYAAIREQRHNKKQKSDLALLKERVDDIERRIP